MNTEHSDHESNDLDAPSGENSIPESPDEAISEPRETAEPTAVARSPRSGRFIAFIALLFSLTALAGAAWMWWQDQGAADAEQTRLLTEIARLDSGDGELRLRIRELRDELDTLASGDVSAEFREMQQRMEADREQLARLEQTIREQMTLSRSLQTATDAMHDRLQAAEAAVTGMSTRELDAGGELDLAEVDYLLRLANQRLVMAADASGAQALISSADNIVRALDDAALHAVRSALAADLAAVRAVPRIDVEGIYLRLSALAEQSTGLVIFQLPNQEDLPQQTVQEDDWQVRLQRGYEEAAAKLSDYIIIRRRDAPMEALMDPQWEGLVRQNLRMLLEQAQVALLSGNQQLYGESLGRARHWVAQFFESDEAAAHAMDSELRELQDQTVAVELPDLSRSLRARAAASEARRPQGCSRSPTPRW